MRIGLRTRILFITVFTPLMLGLAAYITVHRNVRDHVDSTSIHENLEHSASVFESMLAVRLHALVGGARVIAEDPRFFSLLVLGADQRDSRFHATVQGMAEEFNRITATDLFEVYDRKGRLLASVGAQHSERAAREPLMNLALQGNRSAGVLAQGSTHCQVAVTPVRSDGRIVGVLLLGATVDEHLAQELKSQMRSEVTFLAGGTITGTTLEAPEDRAALLAAVEGRDVSPRALAEMGPIQVRGTQATYLTLVGRVPRAYSDQPQLYVMQRSYDPETAFLRRMQQDLGLLAALAVLGALLTGFMLSEQILSPIRALVEGARQMQQGNFDSEIAVRNSDEIGFLAERFRALREHERAYVHSLQEASRVKSDFISIASRGLRTPISVIQGYRDMLAEGSLGEVNPRQHQALQAIRDCLAQLTKVAEDATEAAEIEVQRVQVLPVEAEVRPVVGQAIALATAAARKRRVKLSAEMPPDLGAASLDQARVVEVLARLLEDVAERTSEGSRVVLHADGDGTCVALEIRARGAGLAAAASAPADHGFSLSMARAVAEAHGGTLEATISAEDGTTITLRFPRTAAEERNAA